jgi:type I restriction enzyme, S subunit
MNIKQLTSESYWGTIPNDWNLIPIRQGFSFIGSGTTPPTGQTEFFNGEVPWITTSELRENKILFAKQTVTDLAIEQFSALKIFPKDTVLIAMYGATIGRVAILGIPACVNQAVCAFANPTRFTPEFAAYSLRASKDFLLSLVSGGGQPNLNAEKITSHLIPCPPITKQRKIVDHLDRETQKIDSLIAAKKRLLELLAEKRRSMITQAVTRGLTADVPMKDSAIEYLGDVPKHWNIKPLKYLSSFISGATPDKGNKEYWDGNVPWISPKDMKKEYLLTSSELITDLALKETGIKLVEPPAILVVVRGMILLHSFPVAISTNPTTINQDMKALKCRHNILPDFLARQLQSRRDEILTMTRESGHGTKAIETTLLENLEIVIPPLEEQEAITKYMDKKFIQIDLLVDSTKKTIALLQERRTSLISAAVTGQLLIPD